MKKQIGKISAIILIFQIILQIYIPIISEAVTDTSDTGFEYLVNSDGTSITITGYIGTDTELVIPSNIDGYRVTNIGEYTFEGCNSLVSITIPEGVTSIEIAAFANCTSLTSVSIPNTVTNIGEGVFAYCSRLTNISIPSSVINIGEFAFTDCTSLTSVSIPNTVTNIGEGAFSYCSNLTGIEVNESNKIYKSVNGVLYSKDGTKLECYPIGKEETEYTVLEGVTSIEIGAFADCSSLISINIPNGVVNIGEGAFSYCSGLTNISISSSVISIGKYAFTDCINLTSINIPSSVTNIGEGAFAYCSNLTNIEVNESNKNYKSINGVLYSKDGTKLECYPIGKKETEYTVLEGVTSIEIGAFADCDLITSISIPSSVINIGEYAFAYCSSLTNINIPSSVTSIGYNAFYDCSNLTIRCERDSIAHQYAVENNLPCELYEKVVISSSKYNINDSNKYILKIKVGETKEDIRENITANIEYKIVTKEGKEVTNEKMATGMKIEFITGESYELVVKGDLNGDGKISTTDITKMKKHIIQKELLQGCYEKAGDINEDSKISVTDLANTKKALVGLITL